MGGALALATGAVLYDKPVFHSPRTVKGGVTLHYLNSIYALDLKYGIASSACICGRADRGGKPMELQVLKREIGPCQQSEGGAESSSSDSHSASGIIIMHLLKYYYFAKRYSKKLSFRASAFAFFAVLVALVALNMGHLIPEEWLELLGDNALGNLLEIVTSSMLLVVTFSLATMVSAYASASQGVTPRATRLLLEDNQSQNTISIFLGSFIFSIVTMVALSTTYYDQGARFILFIATALMIVLVVATIIGWIDSLSRLGRVHETISRLESATEAALKHRAQKLRFGCNQIGPMPPEGHELTHDKVGYIQTISYKNLQKIALEHDIEIYVEVEPGTYITPDRPIAKVKGQKSSRLEDKTIDSIRKCYDINDLRSFDQDPRFGFISLSEVASKALSLAVNDPGTAIEVIGSLVRLIVKWDQTVQYEPPIEYDRVYARSIDCEEFLRSIVLPLSRDGAGHLEVVIRLHKALSAMSRLSDDQIRNSANKYKELLIERANQTLTYKDEKDLLSQLDIGKGGDSL